MEICASIILFLSMFLNSSNYENISNVDNTKLLLNENTSIEEETIVTFVESSFVKQIYSNLNGENMKYWLYTPENAKADMPLIVYLHGGSGKGDDLDLITSVDGFPKYLKDGEVKLDAYVIVPQLDEKYKGWEESEKILMQLISYVKNEYKIDEENVSLVGHSMGGTGVWQLALDYPKTFSKIMPMSGSIRASYDNLQKLKSINVWAFVGENDNIVKPQASIQFINSLEKINSNAQITVLEDTGHFEVPSKVFFSNNINAIEWLVS